MKVKLFICNCYHCKHVKNKRKNRNYKKRIKRMLNKKMRNSDGTKVIRFYWA